MNETVSIIVPVYNVDKELKECLNSIVRQTYSDLRILLIDDGSTDRSGEICDQYARKDKRVKVIHQKNGGTNAARMAGIKELSEDGYTAFCDADDFMPLDAVEKLWNFVKETNADVVQGSIQRFFGRHLFGRHIYFGAESKDEKEQIKIFRQEQLQTAEAMSGYFGYAMEKSVPFISMEGKLYRNSLLKKSLEFEKPARLHGEDLAFNMQMCGLMREIVIIPEIVYNYRIGGGTTKYNPSVFEDMLNLYDFKCKYIAKFGWNDFYSLVAAELKNETLGTLISFYKTHKKMPSEVYAEIKRVSNLPQVVHAMNAEMPQNVKFPEFVDAMKKKDEKTVYKILAVESKKRNKTGFLKKILRKI